MRRRKNQKPNENEEEDGNILLRETSSNNFSNPVYENMYGSNRGHQAAENQGLLQNTTENTNNADLIEIINDDQDDPAAVDLLTEKHRGNISL